MISGKEYSIPIDMIFRKRYCSCCGTRLVKDKTKRVVTKDDKDYYEHHEHLTYPKCDVEVYDYIYMCPKCHKRFTVDEQKIIAIMQKENKNYYVSSSQFISNYEKCYHTVIIYNRIKNAVVNTLFLLISAIVFYIFNVFSLKELILYYSFLIVLILISNIIVNLIRKYKRYSIRTIFQVEYVYAKSFANKDELKMVESCYCFSCKNKLNSNEIMDYDEENTALCPHCGKKNIIPVMDKEINDILINNAHNYWY